MDKIPILLLAAGGSTRMGQPKPLLAWGKQTLIEYQIQKLIKTGNPVNVVLGSKANQVIPVIEKFEINIFINDKWESGMGSSIACGIHEISKKYPTADGVLITLVDQPLITTNHLEKLLRAFEPGKKQIIVSQASSGWSGVPVLFDKNYFEELKKLNKKEGAKTVIKKYKNYVLSVKCGEILKDIDTPENYQQMLKNVTLNK